MLRVVKGCHVMGALVRDRQEPRGPGCLLDPVGDAGVVPSEVISSMSGPNHSARVRSLDYNNVYSQIHV
jgi:hypothetical protein